jgi:ABC-type oligopeptide transport system substrate-binding subunit
MKKMFRFAAVGLMLTALPFSACKDDDDDVNCSAENVATLITDHSADIADAAEVFLANPTNANCEAFINELEQYRDFLVDYESCATETLGYDASDWELEIQSLNEVINDGC